MGCGVVCFATPVGVAAELPRSSLLTGNTEVLFSLCPQIVLLLRWIACGEVVTGVLHLKSLTEFDEVGGSEMLAAVGYDDFM